MKETHCRYCEKPLSVLTRLAGDKEFCSKEHRQLYLREHSQAALARLIESEEEEERKRGGKKTRASTRERMFPLPDPVVAAEPVAPQPSSAPALAVTVVESVGDRDVRMAGIPRWRPILIRPPAARMEDGLELAGPGSFLYRPPAPAAAESPWGADRSRIRAVTFPRIAPRMRYLEECLRRTERLGFSTP